MDVERANWRTLDSRMMSAINAPGTPSKIQAWAAYDYANTDIFGNERFRPTATLNTVAVGGDVRAHRQAARRRAVRRTRNTRATSATAAATSSCASRCSRSTAGYGEGPWYVGATLGAGALDYSTERSISSAPATRTETRRRQRVSQRRARCSAATGSSTRTGTTGPFAKLTLSKDRGPAVQRKRQRQHRADATASRKSMRCGRASAGRSPAT